MEKKMKKRNKIIGKIIILTLMLNLIICCCVLPISAAYISSSTSYSVGIPFNVYLGDIGVNGASYILNGYNRVYTNGTTASQMLDDVYMNNSYQPYDARYIDTKVTEFTRNGGRYDYSQVSFAYGNQELVVLQQAYAESLNQQETYMLLRDVLADYEFLDNNMAHIRTPTIEVEPNLFIADMSPEYLPNIYYFTVFGDADYYGAVDSLPMVNFSYDLVEMDEYGIVSTNTYSVNARVSSDYFTIINHNSILENTAHEYIEETYVSMAYAFNYGVSLYSCYFDMNYFYDYLLENHLGDYGVSNFKFYVYFDIYDYETGFLEEWLNNENILGYVSSRYNSLPFYSFGFKNYGVIGYDFANSISPVNNSTIEIINNQYLKNVGEVQYEVVTFEPDFSIIEWLGNTVGDVLNIEIFGYVTFAEVLYVVLGLGLFIAFLKIWSGG